MKRVALLCPGRGAYARTELGSLTRKAASDARAQSVLQRLDSARKGAASVGALDSSERFSSQHLAGENAAALIFSGTLMDAVTLRSDLELVAVGGNSMGFYSALAVSGALGLEQGFLLADAMGTYQRDGVVGGQVIVPVCDDEWRADAAAVAAVDAALLQVQREGLQVAHSIHLGGHAVLAGDDAAVKRLLQLLPKRRIGEREYPFQLLGHSAFHTPLMMPTSTKAQARFEGLSWSAPRLPLVDGRGCVFMPRTACPQELWRYTLGTQVTDTFDFTLAVRVILREFAPDALVLLGPGDSLGSPVAQVLIQEGWQGLHCRSDFIKRQQSAEPIVLSFARDEQRAFVV